MKPLPIEASLLALAALAFGGCVPDQEVAEPAQTKAEPKQIAAQPDQDGVYDNPPVGILVANDHRITIHTGPDGPLFSVKGPDGKQLATEISREELQASFPNVNLNGLWADLEKGENDSSNLDATNYLPVPEPFRVVPKTAPR